MTNVKTKKSGKQIFAVIKLVRKEIDLFLGVSSTIVINRNEIRLLLAAMKASLLEMIN